MEHDTSLLRNLNKIQLIKPAHREVSHSRHLLPKTDFYEKQLFLKTIKTKSRKTKTNKKPPQMYSHRKSAQDRKEIS